LGWTIEEFAATAGIGVSTVISFEAGQRKPMRANLEAMMRAFSTAGVIFTEGADMNVGKGIKLTKSAEVLRDILTIASLKRPEGERLAEAKKRISRYQGEAKSFYEGSEDVPFHVRSALGTLRDTVAGEIARRGQLQLDDQAAHFLEPVLDTLDDLT